MALTASHNLWHLPLHPTYHNNDKALARPFHVTLQSTVYLLVLNQGETNFFVPAQQHQSGVCPQFL